MDKFSSSINILGGFDDFHRINEIILNPHDSFYERTVASAQRYRRAVLRVFNIFPDNITERLFKAALASDYFSEDDRRKILSLQFMDSDNLFRELFTNCFVRVLETGRVSLDKYDVVSYLQELKKLGSFQADWSNETMETVSRKFLSILAKLGYVKGKSKKTIQEIIISKEFLVYFLYWLFVHNHLSNAFSSCFFPVLLSSKEKFVFLVKQNKVRSYFDWNYTGDKITIEPKINLEDYIHAISN